MSFYKQIKFYNIEFIFSTFSNIDELWIGLNDKNRENTFKWTNSDPVIFTKWGSDEPNNLNGDEDCVHMRFNGLWNDNKCDNLLFFYVCQI